MENEKEKKLKNKLESIQKYWDEWINDWYLNFIKENKGNSKILEKWDVPTEHLGNFVKDSSGNNTPYPAYKFLPEPYWGDITTDRIECIFLNINPGGGGENQLYGEEDIFIESEIQTMKEKFQNKVDYKYSDLIKDFSSDLKYDTTKWMLNKRITWLNNIDQGKNKRKSIENNLFFDLVPWHTPSKHDIQLYCTKHYNAILEHVLKPISHLGEDIKGIFEKKIIVRGSTILELFNQDDFSKIVEDIKQYVIVDNNRPLFKFSSLLTTFKLEDLPSTFYVFSGGASMILPNPDYLVYNIGDVTTKCISLREFLTPQPTANSV